MYGPQINRSYFFAVDNKRGWGNTSFFTYFSEFNRPSKQDAYIEAGFLATLFALSTIGNASVIGSILYSKKLRTTTNYFVCNLALADILFVTSGPFVAHIRITETWTLGEEMCHYINYAMFVCGAVIIWTMAAISIDRFICINLKRASPRKLRPKLIFGICSFIWVTAFSLFCPVAIYFEIVSVKTDSGTIYFCSLLWPRGPLSYSAVFTVCVFTVGFIIPFVIIIVNYTRIFKTIHVSRRAIAHASQGVQGVTLPVRTNSIKQRNLRVVKTLVLLVLLFFLTMTPLFITFILIQQDSSNERFIIPSHALIWTVVISFSNACINPFLYGYLNNRLKRSLASICKCKKKRISLRENLDMRTISTVSCERL